MRHPFALAVLAALCITACMTPQEKAAKQLARRIAPEYASRIVFSHKPDTADCYSIEAKGRRLLITGSNANAMAAGFGRYLRDVCLTDVSWYLFQQVELPAVMPLPDTTITGHALVPKRFFLNYCTFGYEMPWWQWADWERLIDWMALYGINMPLAITGQESCGRS